MKEPTYREPGPPPPCRKAGCHLPAIPGRAFCSREHAPLATVYEVRQSVPSPGTIPPKVPGMVSIRELVQITGYAPGTLYDWAAIGRIPSHRRGKFVYFDVEEVRAAMARPEFAASRWNDAPRHLRPGRREGRVDTS